MNSSPAIAAPAGSTFTINVTWKCLTPTVVGNYPCRNSTEIIASYQGGLVYVRSAGIHCSNASKDRHNAFKLNIGKKSSGKILCKTPHYDGVIDYNGSVKRVSDGYTLDISGKYTTEFGGGYKKSRQSLSFTYRVQLKVEGRRCFGTKSWSFKGQINSVPGASGRYSYTTSKCSIGR